MANFQAPDQARCDIILKSTDGVEYRLHKNNLAVLSELFRDMFAAASEEPQKKQNGDLETISLLADGKYEENAEVLNFVLPFIYNGEMPDIVPLFETDLKLGLNVAAFDHKYGMHQLMGTFVAIGLLEQRLNPSGEKALQIFQMASLIHKPVLLKAFAPYAAKALATGKYKQAQNGELSYRQEHAIFLVDAFLERENQVCRVIEDIKSVYKGRNDCGYCSSSKIQMRQSLDKVEGHWK